MPARSPAPLRLALLPLLLAAACGGDGPSWSTSFALGDGPGATTLNVSAWKGAVRLRNGPAGVVEVKLRGKSPLPPEETVVFVSDGRGRALRIHEAAKDAPLDIEIAAPAGISLSCSCTDASVEISGSWGRVEAKTAGGSIAAPAADIASGVLQSQRGHVLYAPSGKGPTGEIKAESLGGDVSIKLPAAWNGLLHFLTQTGSLDVPPHQGLEMILDADKKGIVGRLGPPLKGMSPPVVWGTSAKGKVSFRVAE